MIAELNHRGVRVHRLDPGSFPQVAGLSAYIGPYDKRWAGSLKAQHQNAAFDRVTSVYYRRPSPFRFTDEMSEADARWAESEARAGFGVLIALPCPWINHPHRNAVASVTPIALATAARCGLHRAQDADHQQSR